MSRVPVLSGAQLIKALERAGFKQIRTKGSHVILRNPVTGRGVTVPLHKTVKRGTLLAILRQLNIEVDELTSLL